MVYRFGKLIPTLSALDDLLYPSFVLGAQGMLSAICSILPRESVDPYDAVQSGIIRYGIGANLTGAYVAKVFKKLRRRDYEETCCDGETGAARKSSALEGTRSRLHL